MNDRIPNPEPTAFERANAFFLDAVDACGRNHLRDAIDALSEARRILETEQQFRDARRGQA